MIFSVEHVALGAESNDSSVSIVYVPVVHCANALANGAPIYCCIYLNEPDILPYRMNSIIAFTAQCHSVLAST